MLKIIVYTLLITGWGCVVDTSAGRRVLIGRSRPEAPGWVKADASSQGGSQQDEVIIFRAQSKTDIGLALKQSERQAVALGKQRLAVWLRGELLSAASSSDANQKYAGVLRKASDALIGSAKTAPNISDIYFEEFQVSGDVVAPVVYDVYVLVELPDRAKAAAATFLVEALRETSTAEAVELAAAINRRTTELLAH